MLCYSRQGPFPACDHIGVEGAVGAQAWQRTCWSLPDATRLCRQWPLSLCTHIQATSLVSLTHLWASFCPEWQLSLGCDRVHRSEQLWVPASMSWHWGPSCGQPITRCEDSDVVDRSQSSGCYHSYLLLIWWITESCRRPFPLKSGVTVRTSIAQ